MGATSSQRALRASAALSCVYFAAVGLFNPYAPLWYKDMGLPVFALGLLASLPNYTRLFGPFVWGALADKRGHRARLMRIAALASFISALGLLLPFSSMGDIAPYVLGLVILAQFSFNSGLVPLNETLVASHLKSDTGGMDAARYGHVRVWGSIGFMVMVLISGPVFELVSMKAFPWLVVAVLAVLVWVAWQVPVHTDPVQEQDTAPPLRLVMKRPEVLWFFAGCFLTVLAHAALYSFFSLYLDGLGYSKSTVGMLWGVSVAVEIAWFFLQGRWLTNTNLHGWLLAAALITALRFGLTAAFGLTLWILVLAQCLHAVTFATQHTVCIALITQYFPGRLRGRGQALYTILGYGVSGVVGGLGGAALSHRYDYVSVFWAACAVGLAAALCCWRSLQLARQVAGTA